MKAKLLVFDLDGTLLRSDSTLSERTYEALGKRLSISFEEMVAFEDDKNDIEVLRKCGLGVAVGNAIPEVKQIADLIVDTNDEDGVAKYIEEYLL